MERETQNQRQRDWTRHKPRPRRKNSGPAQAGDVLSALLASLGGGPERARLSLLWQNWEPIMGPELAPLALPLGHHKDILLIGAEINSYFATEIRLFQARRRKKSEKGEK